MALQEELQEQGNWLFRYRGILPILILVLGLAFYLLAKSSPEGSFLQNSPYEKWFQIACLLVGFVGLGIRIYTVGYTPINTSGRRVKSQNADSLNTTGMYSLVRHPLYVGNYLMWLAPTLLTGNIWFVITFTLLYWLYYERIMFAEEQFLRGKFGETYLNWAEKSPAFVPDFKNFVKPNIPFNWKRMLQKERNGLAVLFLIFVAFDVLGELIRDENNYNQIILIGCVISIIAFIVLKFLEKKTTVLDF